MREPGLRCEALEPSRIEFVLLVRRPPRMRDSICREYPELDWFLPGGTDRTRQRAVCSRCAVAGECLGYATTSGKNFGIWGGLSARERRRLVKVAAAWGRRSRSDEEPVRRLMQSPLPH